jgi:calcineurin-like phosphoesterase family protein
MNVFFSSDFHFGHKVIAPKYRNFSSTKEHDEALLDLLSKVKREDVLFILGDFLFDCEEYEWYLEQVAKMPLRIKLLLGNHDSKRLYLPSRPANIELQLPFFSYKNMWLSHCPIHPQEMRRRVANVHGHLHNAVVEDDPRYFNVCLDQHDFQFVSLDIIKQHFNI